MATPAPSPAPFARAKNKDERIGDVFLDAAAIAGIVSRLDPQRCACCRLRVFAECAARPGGEESSVPGG